MPSDPKVAAAHALYVERLTAWAGCVQRLIAVAPTEHVKRETGVRGGTSTPPARKAIREQARAIVERWLARDLDLAALSGYTLVSDAESLDAAWKAAEAALPEGWFMGNLTNQAYRGVPERWMAQAYQGPEEDANYRLFKAASAPTPAEALRNLAAALTPESSNAK